MHNKPTIILGMPSVMGLSNLVEEALIYEGFQVIHLEKLLRKSEHYLSLSDLLYSKYRKLVHKDKETGKIAKGKALIHKLKSLLNGKKVDYALFISADIYSLDLIKFINENTINTCVNYQFDGLNVHPSIKERISLFKDFYVFDKNDVTPQYPNIKLTTNFYFNHLIPKDDISLNCTTTDNCAYYLASHNLSRLDLINQLAQRIIECHKKLNFIIINREPNKIKTLYHPKIKVSDQKVDFQTNLNNVAQSHYLIDFVVSAHSGLSFRTFEAIGYKKKLITTNKTIKEYDFYDENNILIWDETISQEKLLNFMNTPYKELPNEIYAKYSFSSWLKNILKLTDSF